jgi:hypothetical protein
MKSDPVITYNHMEEDDANRKMKHVKSIFTNKMVYVAEAVIIAALLLLMFFLF